MMKKIMLQIIDSQAVAQVIFWARSNLKIVAVILFVVISFISCHHTKKTQSKQQTIVVASQPISTTLYYSGIIQPLKAVAVISPADGVVEDVLFHYGDVVKPGQLLFTINSEKFQTDYKTALVQYVKARSDLDNNHSQLLSGEFLHKNLLISDDEFKVKQTNFYNAQLAFLQAKDALSKMLKQLDIKGLNIYNVSIADVEKITTALHMDSASQKLQIISPAMGIVLLPLKTEAAASTEKKIEKGEQVKQGDVLAMVGDMEGLSIHVKINEFDINQLKVGQKVKVTGSAFSEFVLQGEIVGIDHQAQLNQNGVPSFSAEVVVSTLTPEQKEVIHMGMSAKVEVDVDAPAQITVPILAVTEKNGVAYVNQKDPKTNAFHQVAVKVGKTTADSVVVLANLKAGDKIAIPD